MNPNIGSTIEEINFLSNALNHLRGLSSFPKKYEAPFQYNYLRGNLYNTRLTLLIGVVLFVGSSVFDFTFHANTNSLIIRLYIIAPLLFLIYLLSFTRYAFRYQQVLLAAFTVTAMVGLVSIAYVLPQNLRELLYSSLILLALFVITISKLSFKYTIFVAICLLLTFNIGFIATPATIDKFYLWRYLGNNYLLLGASILVAIASYFNELNMRKQFLMMRLITKKNELSTHLSNYDFITGIANRRYFDKWLDHAWHTAFHKQYCLALLFVDFDYFKEYNDLYGHILGDNILAKIAACLEGSLNNRGVIARYGGDEFVIALENVKIPEAVDIANNLITAVEELRVLHLTSSVSQYVTITIGLSILLPHDKKSVYMLIQNADLALQLGKRIARNNIYIFENETVKKIERHKISNTTQARTYE